MQFHRDLDKYTSLCDVVRRLKNSFFFGSSGAFYCDFYEV
jgi:hypothetical protein